MKRVPAYKFAAYLARWKQMNPTYAPMVSDMTEDDLEEYACWYSYKMDAGFAIGIDGYLTCLHSNKKGQGDELVKAAIRRGADHLDCFDGYLVELYKSHGFEVSDVIAWDDEYAPEGWDYDRFGKPDVVYMSLIE